VTAGTQYSIKLFCEELHGVPADRLHEFKKWLGGLGHRGFPGDDLVSDRVACEVCFSSRHTYRVSNKGAQWEALKMQDLKT